MPSECAYLDCPRAVRARGLCSMHYNQESKSGELASRRRFPRRSSADDCDGFRTCKSCGERKRLDEFVKNAPMPGGRTLDCKRCRNAKVKSWKAENRDRAALHRSAYRRSHPEVDERANRARRARKNAAESDGLVSRDALRRRDGDACNYCGNVMDFSDWSPRNLRAATVDHVVPLVLGGSDTLRNTVLACLSCNTRKGGRPVEGVLRGAV